MRTIKAELPVQAARAVTVVFFPCLRGNLGKQLNVQPVELPSHAVSKLGSKNLFNNPLRIANASEALLQLQGNPKLKTEHPLPNFTERN